MKKKKKGWAMAAEKAANRARKQRIAARQKAHGGYPTRRSKGPKMRLEKEKNKARRRRSRAPSSRPEVPPSMRL